MWSGLICRGCAFNFNPTRPARSSVDGRPRGAAGSSSLRADRRSAKVRTREDVVSRMSRGRGPPHALGSRADGPDVVPRARMRKARWDDPQRPRVVGRDVRGPCSRARRDTGSGMPSRSPGQPETTPDRCDRCGETQAATTESEVEDRSAGEDGLVTHCEFCGAEYPLPESRST